MRQQRATGEPPVDAATQLCISAWRQLHGERAVWGTDLGPIPPSAVRGWAADQDLDRETTEILAEVLRKLDGDRQRQASAKAALETRRGPKR